MSNVIKLPWDYKKVSNNQRITTTTDTMIRSKQQIKMNLVIGPWDNSDYLIELNKKAIKRRKDLECSSELY